ncbi:tripartite tricarboxylate transporter substrate binding protein [Variovorax sp. Sphag1AA]|uniref:Bug family tripartite tricarboxylate transporter substrate binding protein n=1 Tax=Variovorax sp. Sphag1AA TaxID=2587027 RepID=UPI00160A3DD2|nr:tripartite tricarboxylate transporter substrate binding protein [Variovorax sp. Sphag1AA]MBB3178223.1 tripartite-type tricarboxylate transporter receptor subunit TctC [Variovorax sp. Sphag1AA]
MTSKNITRRGALGMTGALLAAATLPVGAQAAYPSRPVKLIVPFPAGTSPDVIARLWGEEFTKATGQAVVVENRPGASTIIAAQSAANAAPDGYTLLWTVNNTFSINPYVYKKLPYKAEDFVPVTRILSVPYVLVTSTDSKFHSLQDLIREAKARPDALTYASAGIGQGTHVAMARLLGQAGISMTHVPYKDYFLPDVIAQRIDVAFDASTGAIPQVKAGKVRALGVSSPKRIDGLPDVPAIAEVVPGFVGDSWHGIFAPKRTPEPVLASLLAQSQKIVAQPAFRAKLDGYGLTPIGEPPEAFRRFLDEDARAWAKVVKDNNITAE